MSVQGFWGLQLKPGKSYTQIVTAPFRIAMASLTAEIENEKRTCVSVKVDKRDFVMCTLIPNKIEQQSLDLNFVEGEEVTFFALGDNAVHLTGNYVFSDDDDDMVSYSGESEGDDDDDEEVGDLPATLTNEQLQALLSGEGDLDLEDDDEDDEEFDGEDSDEDMDEEEEEEEEAPVTKKRPAEVAAKEQPSKKAKKEEAAKKAKEDAAKKAKDESAKKAKEDQKKEKEEAAKKAKEEQKKKKEEPKKVTKLPNGLVIEDDKVGDGASCKSGQRIGMRYIGKLTNGKVFDKNTSGKPFYFVLGRGEVIKGWDIGVAGMKVGGQRKLTIPAPLAYGKRGAPPDIPKNATLVFEIKLVSMK